MRKTAFAVLCACLFALVVLSAPVSSSAQVAISVGFGPPALPVYEQPVCPGDGYIWTPGYWAWDSDDQDYYWVPRNLGSGARSRLPLDPAGGQVGRTAHFSFTQVGGDRMSAGMAALITASDISAKASWAAAGMAGHFFYNREVTNVNVVNNSQRIQRARRRARESCQL